MISRVTDAYLEETGQVIPAYQKESFTQFIEYSDTNGLVDGLETAIVTCRARAKMDFENMDGDLWEIESDQVDKSRAAQADGAQIGLPLTVERLNQTSDFYIEIRTEFGSGAIDKEIYKIIIGAKSAS